jgi:hypothetical protein
VTEPLPEPDKEPEAGAARSLPEAEEPLEPELPEDLGPAPWERVTAWLLLAVPLAGIAVHGVLWHLATRGDSVPPWIRTYSSLKEWGIKAVAVVAIACLVGNWLHFRRTRMPIDIASRIAIYLWILSIVLLHNRVYRPL